MLYIILLIVIFLYFRFQYMKALAGQEIHRIHQYVLAPCILIGSLYQTNSIYPHDIDLIIPYDTPEQFLSIKSSFESIARMYKCDDIKCRYKYHTDNDIIVDVQVRPISEVNYILDVNNRLKSDSVLKKMMIVINRLIGYSTDDYQQWKRTSVYEKMWNHDINN
jgi:hypothetical protein